MVLDALPRMAGTVYTTLIGVDLYPNTREGPCPCREGPGAFNAFYHRAMPTLAPLAVLLQGQGRGADPLAVGPAQLVIVR